MTGASYINAIREIWSMTSCAITTSDYLRYGWVLACTTWCLHPTPALDSPDPLLNAMKLWDAIHALCAIQQKQTLDPPSSSRGWLPPMVHQGALVSFQSNKNPGLGASEGGRGHRWASSVKPYRLPLPLDVLLHLGPNWIEFPSCCAPIMWNICSVCVSVCVWGRAMSKCLVQEHFVFITLLLFV